MRFLYRGLPFPLAFLWLSAHVSGEIVMADMDEGSKGGLCFGIRHCGRNPDGSAYSCRRRGQKRGTEYTAVEHRVAGNQRFAIARKNYQPEMSKSTFGSYR
jgi:hypothetical protein